MTVQARDKLMSLTDISEMLDIPVQTLYLFERQLWDYAEQNGLLREAPR